MSGQKVTSIRPETLQVSLIISSRNRAELLAATVDSVLQGEAIPAELIIIDQSDDPNSILGSRYEEGCTIQYIWTHSKGLSRANNQGAAIAQHDLLLFTHDDVLVAPNWLRTLTQALLDQGPEAVVTGRVLASTEGNMQGFAPALKTDKHGAIYSDASGIGMLKPLNMGLYRSTFDEIGGFDSNLGPGTPFPGAEDSDMGLRLLKKGYLLIYLPEAIVYHRAWRREEDYLPLRWGYGIAQGAFYAKHLKATDQWIVRHIVWDIRRRLRRFPLRLWREPHRALGDPLFLLGNLAGAIRWLLTHRHNLGLGSSSQAVR
jgi:GT2 family glycosyltransferase